MKLTTDKPERPPCHHGNLLVWREPGLEVYGGGIIRGASRDNIDLVLQLYNGYANNMTMLVPIEDYEVPVYPPGFWGVLNATIRILLAYQAKAPARLLVMCVGGHGRTGVVAACLAIVTGQCEGDPVAWVRKHYCKQAVDTPEQEDYVRMVYKYYNARRGL